MTDVLSWIRLEGPFLLGHRGFPEAARENTVPSFEAALEAGCDGVELDVRMTRDGLLAVHHDEAVPGPRGPVPLADATWDELLRGAAYRVERFEDVIASFSGRCLLNVEAKPAAPERRASLALALDALLDRVRPRESVLVSSFDPELLSELHRVNKELLLGFLFSELEAFNHLEQTEIALALTSIHPRHPLVDRKLMKRAEEGRLQVHAWTVDDPKEVSRLLEMGVTSIITNRPDRCAGAFNAGL